MKSPSLTHTGLFSLLCVLGVAQIAPPLVAASHNVNTMPPTSSVDGTKLRSPAIGSNTLHVLSPNLLELVRVNGKKNASSAVGSWDFVNSLGDLSAPGASRFSVTVDGQPVAVQTVTMTPAITVNTPPTRPCSFTR